MGALLAACSAEDWRSTDYGQPDGNRVRLRVECYSFSNSIVHGRSDWGPQSAYTEWVGETVLRAQVEWNRFQFSTTPYERITGWFAYSYFPIRVGYTIWERPVGYVWRAEGLVPEVAAELTVYWWNEGPGKWDRVPIAGRADIVVGVDMLGTGLSLSAGVLGIRTLDGHHGHGIWHTSQGLSPNVELRLRIGTFAFDLSRD